MSERTIGTVWRVVDSDGDVWLSLDRKRWVCQLWEYFDSMDEVVSELRPDRHMHTTESVQSLFFNGQDFKPTKAKFPITLRRRRPKRSGAIAAEPTKAVRHGE